jgi:hypothetical protein
MTTLLGKGKFFAEARRERGRAEWSSSKQEEEPSRGVTIPWMLGENRLNRPEEDKRQVGVWSRSRQRLMRNSSSQFSFIMESTLGQSKRVQGKDNNHHPRHPRINSRG